MCENMEGSPCGLFQEGKEAWWPGESRARRAVAWDRCADVAGATGGPCFCAHRETVGVSWEAFTICKREAHLQSLSSKASGGREA